MPTGWSRSAPLNTPGQGASRQNHRLLDAKPGKGPGPNAKPRRRQQEVASSIQTKRVLAGASSFPAC
jgi:hypothetical protein